MSDIKEAYKEALAGWFDKKKSPMEEVMPAEVMKVERLFQDPSYLDKIVKQIPSIIDYVVKGEMSESAKDIAKKLDDSIESAMLAFEKHGITPKYNGEKFRGTHDKYVGLSKFSSGLEDFFDNNFEKWFIRLSKETANAINDLSQEESDLKYLNGLYRLLYDTLFDDDGVITYLDDLSREIGERPQEEPDLISQKKKVEWLGEQGLDAMVGVINNSIKKRTPQITEEREVFQSDIRNLFSQVVLSPWARIKSALEKFGFNTDGNFRKDIFEKRLEQFTSLEKFASNKNISPSQFKKEIEGTYKAYKEALETYQDNPKMGNEVVKNYFLIALSTDGDIYTPLKEFHAKVTEFPVKQTPEKETYSEETEQSQPSKDVDKSPSNEESTPDTDPDTSEDTEDLNTEDEESHIDSEDEESHIDSEDELENPKKHKSPSEEKSKNPSLKGKRETISTNSIVPFARELGSLPEAFILFAKKFPKVIGGPGGLKDSELKAYISIIKKMSKKGLDFPQDLIYEPGLLDGSDLYGPIERGDTLLYLLDALSDFVKGNADPSEVEESVIGLRSAADYLYRLYKSEEEEEEEEEDLDEDEDLDEESDEPGYEEAKSFYDEVDKGSEDLSKTKEVLEEVKVKIEELPQEESSETKEEAHKIIEETKKEVEEKVEDIVIEQKVNKYLDNTEKELKKPQDPQGVIQYLENSISILHSELDKLDQEKFDTEKLKQYLGPILTEASPGEDEDLIIKSIPGLKKEVDTAKKSIPITPPEAPLSEERVPSSSTKDLGENGEEDNRGTEELKERTLPKRKGGRPPQVVYKDGKVERFLNAFEKNTNNIVELLSSAKEKGDENSTLSGNLQEKLEKVVRELTSYSKEMNKDSVSAHSPEMTEFFKKLYTAYYFSKNLDEDIRDVIKFAEKLSPKLEHNKTLPKMSMLSSVDKYLNKAKQEKSPAYGSIKALKVYMRDGHGSVDTLLEEFEEDQEALDLIFMDLPRYGENPEDIKNKIRTFMFTYLDEGNEQREYDNLVEELDGDFMVKNSYKFLIKNAMEKRLRRK